MEKLLDSMIASFPEIQIWICGGHGDNNPNIRADLIRELREKMLSSGELLEVDEARNIGLPVYAKKVCTKDYSRVYGLSGNATNKYEYVGITRVYRTPNFENEIKLCEDIDIEKLLGELYKTATWNKMQSVDNYEFFNPYSKKPPYQSWADSIPNSDKYILARTSLYNRMHEYCLIKKEEGGFSNSLLMQTLTEWKEERRIILALRKNVNNPMQADYTNKGEVYILKLFCGLPLREQIAMNTFCWPLNSMGDKYNYVIPNFIWENVRIILNNMGITLREKNDG